jgi:hypothetical protein
MARVRRLPDNDPAPGIGVVPQGLHVRLGVRVHAYRALLSAEEWRAAPTMERRIVAGRGAARKGHPAPLRAPSRVRGCRRLSRPGPAQGPRGSGSGRRSRSPRCEPSQWRPCWLGRTRSAPRRLPAQRARRRPRQPRSHTRGKASGMRAQERCPGARLASTYAPTAVGVQPVQRERRPGQRPDRQ